MAHGCYFRVFEDNLHSLDFHPNTNLLAVASISGEISLWNWGNFESGLDCVRKRRDISSESIRQAKFTTCGTALVSCSSDGVVTLSDVETLACKQRFLGHKCAVNAVSCFDTSVVATGDDRGEIRIWDVRLGKRRACVAKIKEFEEPIAAIEIGRSNNEFLAIGGDQLGCFVLAKHKIKLRAMSDNLENELLCIQKIKNDSKVICGTQTGTLCLFTYGNWGDLNDTIPVNKDTISQMVKLREDLVVTCGDDGNITLVRVHPNKVMGNMDRFKSHAQTPIVYTDSIVVNATKTLLAFVANSDFLFVLDCKEAFDLAQGKPAEDDFFNDL